jgi:hypothetical protein
MGIMGARSSCRRIIPYNNKKWNHMLGEMVSLL